MDIIAFLKLQSHACPLVVIKCSTHFTVDRVIDVNFNTPFSDLLALYDVPFNLSVTPSPFPPLHSHCCWDRQHFI